MTTDKPKVLTPLDKVKQRQGPCVAPSTTCECAAFAYTSTKDGFRTCVCGHTQHSHAKGNA